MSTSTEAWVTLATNDSYAMGAMVLASSLRRSGTTRKVVVMVTPQSIAESIMSQLSSVFDEVIDVERLDSGDSVRLALLERPELGVTFTKLHCWNLLQYTKCVFLDADTMVVQNSDELFDREEFSAAPDAGWPDCFNSGVFVFVPSRQTFEALMEFASRDGSFDGGDQGLLNSYFADWATADIKKHLPFLYNMVATATYTYLPAFKKFGSNVKIVHFIGSSKPWHATFDKDGQPVPSQSKDCHAVEHLVMWWRIFRADVLPKMSVSGDSPLPDVPSSMMPANVAGSAEAFEKFEEQMHKHAWEDGHPDFRGVSSMDNILKKIDSTIAAPDNDRKN